MPIVGYKPAEEPPQPLAFFGYGCCVSTTQSLWMIIGTFVLAVVMIVSCCFAAVFVRWVYKRRMRKKLQSLKDKYSQEEKHKKEIETNLRELAKRPILRPPRNPTTSAMKSIEKSLQQMSTKRSNEQFNPSGQAQQNQLPAPLKETAPVIPPQIKKLTTEPEKTVEKVEKAKGPLPPKYFVDAPGPILFESKTMAGVVHQLAQSGACRRSNQPPFPGIVVKEHRKMEEKKECQETEESTQKDDENEIEETQKDESPVEGKDLSESSDKEKQKKRKTTENEKRKRSAQSQELEVDVTQDQEEKVDKKLKKSKADFPYWKGSSPEQSSNSPTSTAKADQNSTNTVTSDNKSKNESMESGKSKDGSPCLSIQKTQPSVSPSFRNTPPQAFNVYELRRIAEQQARVAETERAKELLGERATAIASKRINVEEIRKRIGGQPLPKHSASVVNTNGRKRSLRKQKDLQTFLRMRTAGVRGRRSSTSKFLLVSK